MVFIESLQQTLDVALGKPPEIIAVIDIAGGRTDQYQTLENSRAFDCGENSYHGANRVADEDDRLAANCIDDFENILRVSAEVPVFVASVAGNVGFSCAHVIE